jgi:hypothetical protein
VNQALDVALRYLVPRVAKNDIRAEIAGGNPVAVDRLSRWKYAAVELIDDIDLAC